MTTLQTRRLILRPPALPDLDGFAAFYGQSRASFVGGPLPRREDAWRVFAALAGMWHLRGWGPFVIVHDENPIGHGGPWWPADGAEPEIGWALWCPGMEGAGMMQEAIETARYHAQTTLGLPRLVSYIHPSNIRSLSLARRLGAHHDPATLGTEPGIQVWRHPAPGTHAHAHGSHTERTSFAHAPEGRR